jgi:hypothetical protein
MKKRWEPGSIGIHSPIEQSKSEAKLAEPVKT